MQLGSFKKVEKFCTEYGSLEHGELFVRVNNPDTVFVKTDETESDGWYWAMKISGDAEGIGKLVCFCDSEEVYPVVIEKEAVFRYAADHEFRS